MIGLSVFTSFRFFIQVATTNGDMNLRETNGFSNVGKRETWCRAQVSHVLAISQ
jgi:hypothetical protein